MARITKQGDYIGDIAMANAIRRLDSNDALMNAELASLAVGWSYYKPSWTATTVAPAIIDGTITGLYRVLFNECHVHLFWEAGATTTFGTGAWSFSLPVTSWDRIICVGAAHYLDSGGPAFYSGVVIVDPRSRLASLRSDDAGSLTSTVPFTWAAGDQINFSVKYPIAGQ